MFCVQFDWPMYMQIMGLVLCVPPRVCNEQQPAVALKVVIVLE